MTDKKRNNRILSIFIALSLLMGVVCNMAIPVSAAPSVDATSFNFNSFYYYSGQNTYTMSDASASYEIKIPLYCIYYSSLSDGSYLNGYIRTSLPNYNFSFNGSNIAPSYFEVNSAPGLSCSNPTSNLGTMTVYFDNHIKYDNVLYILGYYVFNFSEYTSLSISVTPGSGLVQRDPTVYTMYSSASEFGLAQAIVTAINNSSDINTILNGLQDISENTELLTDVISGLSDNAALLTQIYQRLGQMQSADQTFYNNIDNIIDNVTWRNFGNSSIEYSTDFSTWNTITTGLRPNSNYYFRIKPLYDARGNNGCILDINTGIGISNALYTNRFTCSFYTGIDRKLVYPTYYTYLDKSYYTHIVLDVSNYRYVDYIYFSFYISGSMYVYSTESTILGIYSSDIEFWSIKNTLINNVLYELITNYINANVSTPVDQAATQAAGLAIDQHAAEASLAALSPADMGDFDSAVSEITILDDVSQSLVFWTNAVNAFSLRSGSLWGVFIFGLLIGLIAFILRLRR